MEFCPLCGLNTDDEHDFCILLMECTEENREEDEPAE